MAEVAAVESHKNSNSGVGEGGSVLARPRTLFFLVLPSYSVRMEDEIERQCASRRCGTPSKLRARDSLVKAQNAKIMSLFPVREVVLLVVITVCAVPAPAGADQGNESIWNRRPTTSDLTYSELTVDSDATEQSAPQLVPLPQTAVVVGIGLATAFWIRRRVSSR